MRLRAERSSAPSAAEPTPEWRGEPPAWRSPPQHAASSASGAARCTHSTLYWHACHPDALALLRCCWLLLAELMSQSVDKRWCACWRHDSSADTSSLVPHAAVLVFCCSGGGRGGGGKSGGGGAPGTRAALAAAAAKAGAQPRPQARQSEAVGDQILKLALHACVYGQPA